MIWLLYRARCRRWSISIALSLLFWKITTILFRRKFMYESHFVVFTSHLQTFEEEEEVYSRPRNPWSRIDCLHSARHVVIQFHGVTVWLFILFYFYLLLLFVNLVDRWDAPSCCCFWDWLSDSLLYHERRYAITGYISLNSSHSLDLNMTLFEETETEIYCSYRGKQSYWSLKESERVCYFFFVCYVMLLIHLCLFAYSLD
jgi:uncharacterized protein (DUF427 family)